MRLVGREIAAEYVLWRDAAVSAGAGPRIKVSVFHRLDEIEDAWLEFQARAHGTFYQGYQWCKAWQETVGASNHVRPRIVTGRDYDGRLLFLLPLSLQRRGRCVVLDWLGAPQNNYGLGLYDKGFLRHAKTWFGSQGWSILKVIGGFDAVDLSNMPLRWSGFDHPLSSWMSIAGANHSYVTRLAPGYDTLYAAKRSPETRRGNRKRDAKLLKDADIFFGLPASRADAHARLDEMFKQQQGRLAGRGIHGVFGETERAFIHRLADLPDHLPPVLLPYHLMIDGHMEAMMLGGNFGGGYWALISSIGCNPQAMRYSPGDAALRRTIAACCAGKLDFFDFSSGRSEYKLHWADETLSLHHALRARTLKGYGWALARMTTIALKRAIKASPTLWQMTMALRRKLAGSSES